MYHPVQPYEEDPIQKKILQSTIDNPQSKLYSHSSMFVALNALKLWTFWHTNKRDNRLIAYSRTTYNSCKNNNKWNLFHELKAPIVDISLDKGRGKSLIRIHVETPPVLMEWLRQPESLARLEDEQENNTRVGQLIIKLYDYNQFGQLEGPRQFICLTDYLMVVLIMQHLSPIVSPYKDIQLELKVPNASVQNLSLRQFIPREIEWGISKFISPYTQVIHNLFKNRPLKFEIRYEHISQTDCIRHVNGMESFAHESLPDEYVLVQEEFHDGTRELRYFRVVAPIKILKSGFQSYPFDSVVRDQMVRQLGFRLLHCAKECKAKPIAKEKTLDDFLPDFNMLPALPALPLLPTVSVSSVSSGSAALQSSLSQPTITQVVETSVQAALAKTTSKTKPVNKSTSFHDRTPTTTTPKRKICYLGEEHPRQNKRFQPQPTQQTQPQPQPTQPIQPQPQPDMIDQCMNLIRDDNVPTLHEYM